jgi:hypothetical protein
MRTAADLVVDAGDVAAMATALEELWVGRGLAAELEPDEAELVLNAARLLDRGAYRAERTAARLRAIARHPEPTQEGPTP